MNQDLAAASYKFPAVVLAAAALYHCKINRAPLLSSLVPFQLSLLRFQLISSLFQLVSGSTVGLRREHVFAFVFREAHKSSIVNDGLLKRKPEELGAGNKGLEGIDIGALNGPISLEDLRRLEKSKKELKLCAVKTVHLPRSMNLK